VFTEQRVEQIRYDILNIFVVVGIKTQLTIGIAD
jgi:hypothetical protein